MTVSQQIEQSVDERTGAPPDRRDDWRSIDWASAVIEVRRLQVRIAKAAKDGRWNKVKALQHMLVHSRNARRLAVRRVTENRGKNTPGVDGVTWSTPEAKSRAVDSLKTRGYQPKPLRRVYIPKSNGSVRPLGIPTMHDRAMQALFKLALEPVAENQADPNSYGFRPYRSAADAIEQCFNVLCRKGSPQWILEADIRSCFDNISHEWLLENIPMDRKVLGTWLKSGFIDKGKMYATNAGTPQGGIISPILANMTLDGLENLLWKRYRISRFGKFSAGKYNKYLVNIVRYADDFIITGISRELLRDEILPFVRDFLAERGLELSSEKTLITHIDDGFLFLGTSVRKYNGKLLIRPSRKNVTAFLAKIREVVKENASATQEGLIRTLNPIIMGWAEYHHHFVAKATFAYVDNQIWYMLWQWARRRHPNKNARWVKNRYWHSTPRRAWLFAARTTTGRLFALHVPGKTKIVRHAKIKADANPYDPAWDEYLKQRSSFQFRRANRRRSLVRKLWDDQKGLCPRCGLLIEGSDVFDKHHVVYRSRGGPDDAENLQLMHRTCHQQIHTTRTMSSRPVSRDVDRVDWLSEYAKDVMDPAYWEVLTSELAH